MAVKVKPQWEDIEIGRKKGKIESATLRFNILGCKEVAEADAALKILSPSVILGVLARDTSTTSRIANNGFEGIVEYKKPEPGDRGEEELEEDEEDHGFGISFDTTGGTQHISQSYMTRGSYAAPGYVAPNHNGAIGVDDGDVKGCDIIVPVLGFSMSKQLSGVEDTIDTPFLKMLASMTGKVNSKKFQGFAPGEILFEGASGSKQGKGAWDVTYKFKASPNVASMSVGGIEIGPKYGWDYFWVQYIETTDDEAITTKKIPVAGFVEVVYGQADLTSLLY